MAKGLFTQGMCVLLREPMSIDEVEQQLSMFTVVGRHESMEDDDAPETLVFEYLPESEGHLLVTPSQATWPDDMGGADENPEAFVAWSLGQYGPLAFPNCLKRSIDLSSEGGESNKSLAVEKPPQEAAQHGAHIRLLISYVVGTEDSDDLDEDLPLLPDEYNPIDELHCLTRAVAALLDSPKAICYFNPGGEVLLDQNQLRRILNQAWSEDILPLSAWTSIRRLEGDQGWEFLDTVGYGQFDLPDVEAIYHPDRYQEDQIAQFVRDVSMQLFSNLSDEEILLDGQTVSGPGGVEWVSMLCDFSLADPPRPAVRWVPVDGHDAPERMLTSSNAEELDEYLDQLDDDFGMSDGNIDDDELDGLI